MSAQGGGAVRMTQLDLFTPPAPSPAVYEPRPRHEVQTRAFSHDGKITIYGDEPEPFDLTVRDVSCVISAGFCTHAVSPPGSLFWSETGFRSFGYNTMESIEVVDRICAYIDAPVKAYGCGGKLTRWWPSYVLQWRQSLGFEIEMTARAGREGIWVQGGPDAWVDHWQRHDAQLAAAVKRMRADGIDPNEVGPPNGFKGKWPKFSFSADQIAEHEVRAA